MNKLCCKCTDLDSNKNGLVCQCFGDINGKNECKYFAPNKNTALSADIKEKLEKALKEITIEEYNIAPTSEDLPVILRFFIPNSPINWLVAAGKEEPSGDWTLYGLFRINPNRGWIWSSVSLSELEQINAIRPNYKAMLDTNLEKDISIAMLRDRLDKQL